jgi:hypothetical protein
LITIFVKIAEVDNDQIPPLLANRLIFDLTKGDIQTRLDELATSIQRQLRMRKVFVCHSSKDKPIVGKIVSALRKEKSISLWYDEDNLKPGSIIRRGIEKGISTADYLLAIISTNSIDTIQGWIGFELDQAYEIERQRNQSDHYFTIPVIIEKGINLPGWLGTKVYVDLTHEFDCGITSILEAINEQPPRIKTN